MSDGARVTAPAQWAARKAELRKLLTEQMYGEAPPRPESMRFVVVDDTKNALGGVATRKQVTILLNGKSDGPRLHLLLYTPNHVVHPPIFLGFNFWGNETINADPGILISSGWTQITANHPPDPETALCLKDHRATAECRGIDREKWPIDAILKRGYGLATVFRADIDPDFIGSYKDSLKVYYPRLQGRGDNFSTIGAWAWALSRVMDYLETDRGVDATRVAVFGWSRLGKAALWASATDPRFALAISDDSGAGGAKLFRRDQGETIRDLNTHFPYWFCDNFKKYNDRDRTLPFDQHMVIAMIAPRPVYIASAIDDHWADPEGEFLSAVAATPVYKLLGTDGLPTARWPAVDHPVMGQIGYHVRTGGHDITPYDWAQYLNFADMHLQPKHAERR
ncbi:MAG: acetylxylan esterase [Bryobacteraceae bacterium]